MTYAYGAGDWFAVPLRDQGFAVGIVARSMPQQEGVNLGYFYGPRRSVIPDLAELEGLMPVDAVLVERFGDLGLISGNWPLIGRSKGWNRGLWPLPSFSRYEELTGRAYRVIYDDSDPNRMIRQEAINKDDLDSLMKDRLAGAGAIEVILSRRLP